MQAFLNSDEINEEEEDEEKNGNVEDVVKKDIGGSYNDSESEDGNESEDGRHDSAREFQSSFQILSTQSQSIVTHSTVHLTL